MRVGFGDRLPVVDTELLVCAADWDGMRWKERGVKHVLDRMVQWTGQTRLDASASNDWDDMAIAVSGDLGEFWLCDSASGERQSELVGSVAVCDQLGSESDLHADPIWNAEPSLSFVGHCGGVDHDSLVHASGLAALQMGFPGTDPVFHLGDLGDDPPVLHHLSELGQVTV